MMSIILLSLMVILPQPSWGAQIPLPFFESKQLTPYWPSEKAATPALTPATVTAFHVINQNGRPVSEKNLENHISLVSFFFAECPSLCPTMMMSIKKLQKKLRTSKNDVKIYSFSVKPEADPPERLREYAESFGIDSKAWTLLTGDRREIYHVGKDMFKADGSIGAQKSDSSFIHTQNIYLVDSKLRIRGIYDTSDSKAMDLLAKDVFLLKHE